MESVGFRRPTQQQHQRVDDRPHANLQLATVRDLCEFTVCALRDCISTTEADRRGKEGVGGGFESASTCFVFFAPGAKSRRISETTMSIPEHLRASGGISGYLYASMSICEHLWVSVRISGRICAYLSECTHRTSDAVWASKLNQGSFSI